MTPSPNIGYRHVKRIQYDTNNRPPLEPDYDVKCTCNGICDDRCVNRHMAIECNSSNCCIGNNCSNRQLTMLQAKKCKKESELNRGFGLKILEKVGVGDLIMEYAGEAIDSTTKKIRTNEPHDDYYIMSLTQGWFIDARMVGNLSRFINHSCDPNCISKQIVVKGQHRCGIYAKRNIGANEFLSIDYKYQFTCFCGSKNCRGTGQSGGSTKQKQGAVIDSIKRKRGGQRIYYPPNFNDMNPDEFKAWDKEAIRERKRASGAKSYAKKKLEQHDRKKAAGRPPKYHPENAANMTQEEIKAWRGERTKRANLEAAHKSYANKKMKNN